MPSQAHPLIIAPLRRPRLFLRKRKKKRRSRFPFNHSAPQLSPTNCCNTWRRSLLCSISSASSNVHLWRITASTVICDQFHLSLASKLIGVAVHVRRSIRINAACLGFLSAFRASSAGHSSAGRKRPVWLRRHFPSGLQATVSFGNAPRRRGGKRAGCHVWMDSWKSWPQDRSGRPGGLGTSLPTKDQRRTRTHGGG